MTLRELNLMNRHYELLMAMNDEDFTFYNRRHQLHFEGMTRHQLAQIYADKKARQIRAEEENDCFEGRKRLTRYGDLIDVPTSEDLRAVDELLGFLGL